MKTILVSLCLLVAVLFLSGCGSTPAPAPEDDAPARVDVVQIADEIAAHLLSGNVTAAEDLITRVEVQAAATPSARVKVTSFLVIALRRCKPCARALGGWLPQCSSCSSRWPRSF